MAASDYGLYRSDGIQSSGTALRYGGGNVYIYNSAGQIYPRQVVENVSYNSSSWGGFTLTTIRQSNDWKAGTAKQGYYYQTSKTDSHWEYGTSREHMGCIFFNQGKPNIYNVSSGRVTGCKVKYAKFTLNRTIRTGAWTSQITGVLRQLNLGGASGRWADVSLNDAVFRFTWRPYGEITEVEGYEGSDLCNFLQRFLTDGNVNGLCLYNGETGIVSGWHCSAEYGGGSSFTLDMTVERTVQL